MRVTKRKILGALPPYRDEWIMVKKNQNVNDIINQVLNAHEKYAAYYDKFALSFDADDLETTCDALYNFCQDNIAYKEEPGDDQTTALPTGILTRGSGDCKHYASFCGGVLDSIARQTGKKIDWSYRFASYRPNKKAHHVFIVVNDHGQEYWIDPVPGANKTTPLWILDKKVKVSPMALYDNIGYITGDSVGWTVETSTGYTSSGPTIVPKVGDSFYGSDYLGLSRYGNPTNTNLATLTQQLNEKIAKGPSPYTLQQSLVEKVLRDNVQNWNFYYPKGTSPNPRAWDQNFGHYVKLIITQDGRLVFDRDVEPPHNLPEIHHIVDQANFYVQQFSPTPYIVLIDHLKRLGKGWKTPGEGSLWDLIHTGDVHYKVIADMVKKIPGLDAFLAQYGLSTATLDQYASKFLKTGGGGGSTTNPGIPNVPGGQYGTDGSYIPPQTAGASSSKTMLIVAAAGVGAYFLMRKKKPAIHGIDNNTLLIGGAVIALYFLSRKKSNAPSADPGQTLPIPVVAVLEPSPSSELPVTTTTPVQDLPPFVAIKQPPSAVPYQYNDKDVFIDILNPPNKKPVLITVSQTSPNQYN